jgi:hypothetical protein
MLNIDNCEIAKKMGTYPKTTEQLILLTTMLDRLHIVSEKSINKIIEIDRVDVYDNYIRLLLCSCNIYHRYTKNINEILYKVYNEYEEIMDQLIQDNDTFIEALITNNDIMNEQYIKKVLFKYITTIINNESYDGFDTDIFLLIANEDSVNLIVSAIYLLTKNKYDDYFECLTNSMENILNTDISHINIFGIDFDTYITTCDELKLFIEQVTENKQDKNNCILNDIDMKKIKEIIKEYDLNNDNELRITKSYLKIFAFANLIENDKLSELLYNVMKIFRYKLKLDALFNNLGNNIFTYEGCYRYIKLTHEIPTIIDNNFIIFVLQDIFNCNICVHNCINKPIIKPDKMNIHIYISDYNDDIIYIASDRKQEVMSIPEIIKKYYYSINGY